MSNLLENKLNELELMKASLEAGNISLESLEDIVTKLNAIVDDSKQSLHNFITQIDNNEETVHNTEG